jgi:ADP-ribose pyrophosphatase YjhB (NUDIX family)
VDDTDRVLLVRSSEATGRPGFWSVPGGGIRHGEHPAAAVTREVREETGLTVAVVGLRVVLADVGVGSRDELRHTDRIVYDVRITGGRLRPETHGTTDLVAFVPRAELAGLPLLGFTAELLGLPVPASALPADPVPADPLPADPAPAATRPAAGRPAAGRPRPPGARPGPDRRTGRGQRFAAYGLVTDPAGRVLLTLIARGFPGGGRWHLPGGGTDHGERPEAALVRELAEEADQAGRITGLLGVSQLYNPAAVGLAGQPVDWHAVRVLYRVEVDAPTEATVTEAAGGSTERAGWFTPEQAARLPLTEVAAEALRRLADARSPRQDSLN